MATFPSDTELMTMLTHIVDDILKEMGIKISSSKVISGPNPTKKNYIRTGDVKRGFLGAYAKQTSGDDIGWVLYNSDVVVPTPAKASYLFNHHMSWDRSSEWNGLYIPDYVPIWLNDGFTIVNQRGERAKFSGTKYIEKALGITALKDGVIQDKIEKEVSKRLYKKLQERGVI